MRNTIKTAVILAGGLGTRLRNIVPNVPKPMAPINGIPFLEYQIDYWIKQGIRRFILSVGYRHEYIIEHFGNLYHHADIEYAVEKSPLGTGGGLLLALQCLQEDKPLLVLNGDTFFEVNLEKLTTFHIAKNSHWTFSLFKSIEKERYMGIHIQNNGRILCLKSENEGLAGNLSNGGVYLISPNILINAGYMLGTKVSLENDVIPALMKKGIVLYGCEFNGRFIDIGLPADYLRASDFFKQ